MAKAPPFAPLTKTWHNTSYQAIDPKRPELSAKGKSLLITGGGTGIGAAVAYSFATAGVREIALLGRTQATLSASGEAIQKDFPDAKILTIITDVAQQASVNAAFAYVIKQFGKIDICVSNAGYTATPATIATTDIDNWYRAMDVNVKGALYVVQAFLKDAKAGSYLFNTSSGIGHMHLSAFMGISAYAASKAAGIMLFEYVANENPGIMVFNVQPGMIDTATSEKGNNQKVDVDDVDLAGNFYVWLASPEATFLRGKMVWSNWDVEELKDLKDQILGDELIDIGMKGLSWKGWDPSFIMENNRLL